MCIPSIEARSTERGYESIVKYCFFIVLVLIDTWWNVNHGGIAGYRSIWFVLIDTWWNVNVYNSFVTFPYQNRFNRYMVECECYRSQFWIFERKVLIDTWWNVNMLMVTRTKAVLPF